MQVDSRILLCIAGAAQRLHCHFERPGVKRRGVEKSAPPLGYGSKVVLLKASGEFVFHHIRPRLRSVTFSSRRRLYVFDVKTRAEGCKREETMVAKGRND